MVQGICRFPAPLLGWCYDALILQVGGKAAATETKHAKRTSAKKDEADENANTEVSFTTNMAWTFFNYGCIKSPVPLKQKHRYMRKTFFCALLYVIATLCI